MNDLINVLKPSETATFKLRTIYESSGYKHYKMSKFEEYDLYSSNKDFLPGGNVITFTDMDGRLMALKPDVTMSIIKNSNCQNGSLEKLYYNENVYRSGRSGHFKEIMQTGLECLGDIDTVSTCEVISLAKQSLEAFSCDCVLDISHMGILSGIVDETGLNEEKKRELLGYIEKKSVHEIISLANENGISEKCLRKLSLLCSLDTDCENTLSALEPMCESEQTVEAVNELRTVFDVVGTDKLRLDFSVVQDMSYYNGIVFQGFINGIPEKILSGGRYDRLVRRMGKKHGAIGFGIETDLLEKIYHLKESKVEAVAILYSARDDAKLINESAKFLREQGKNVALVKNICDKTEFDAIYRLCDGGLEAVE